LLPPCIIISLEPETAFSGETATYVVFVPTARFFMNWSLMRFVS